MTENFSHEIIQSIIALVCHKKGFHSISQSAMDVLIGAVIRFIEKISETAQKITSNSGRAESNVYDVLYSMIENGINSPVWVIMNYLASDKNNIPKYEYSIRQYPISPKIKFYIDQTLNMQKQIKEKIPKITDDFFLPYRANTTIKYTTKIGQMCLLTKEIGYNEQKNENENPIKSQNHIPPFFPPLPERFSYSSKDFKSDIDNQEKELQEELLKKREDDLQNIKKELSKLSNIQMIKFTNLECELANKLDESEFIAIPNQEISSKEFKFGGRDKINPELLPFENFTKENFRSMSASSKEIDTYVSILNSVNNLDKNAKDK